VALTEVIRETGLPLAAIHHDILSEGAYKFKPTCDRAKTIIEGYYPPQMPNIRHWTINSRNRKALKGKGVDADIIHDSMDFGERLDPASHKEMRTDLRNRHDIKPDDIVFLVGARIVPNKRIEIAGRITAILHDRRQEIIGRKLYNGETFTGQGRVVLVLAGRPEVAFLDYQHKLFDLFDTLNIDWTYVGDEVRPLRSKEQGLYALYPDMYAMADFVLYPTGWEGFGNQLLEAFAAGLPAAVFEYPVYKEDIGPKGVKIVSLGDAAEESPDGLMQIPRETLDRAAGEIINILTGPDKYREIAENNIEVGRHNFSFDVLRAHLNDALSWAQSFKA
jgi:glycosyltransferase involved in cell wall biosynthesis